MFQGRMMKKLIGSGVALIALASMMGTAGAIEAGNITVATAAIRTAAGIIAFIAGAMIMGGLE